MTRTIYCQKLQKEAEGLESPPFPGNLGKKIYDNISKEAWDEWVKLQTTLINEYRLNMLEPQARDFLITEMESFLFEKPAKKEQKE